MRPVLSKVRGLQSISLSYYSKLIQQCLSIKSLDLTKYIHVRLIKLGFNSHTFLGNCCVELYSRFTDVNDVLRAFEDITSKNTISWNICLKGLVQIGELDGAYDLFDQMPERDVVGWNTMISGYASYGFLDNAFKLFLEMQNSGVKPSNYTWSILTSIASCTCHGKQIHGSMIRNGNVESNVVIWNSVINMYGKIGLIDYAFGVFLSMEKWDVISWNSLIWSCHREGFGELALDQFGQMRSFEYFPDEFTMSSIITICSNQQDLETGKQIFSLCTKMGFLSNSIVSSALINLFSKCNRLEDSISLFVDMGHWDSAVCNSMIASYVNQGFAEDALHLFVLTLRKNLTPTEFTISMILSSVTGLFLSMCGIQVHCLAVKLGVESDTVTASSLVEMYAKYGMIDSSMRIFLDMDARDLLCWNCMIVGLALNGRIIEAIDMFKRMLEHGLLPDHVTYTGALSACKYGGFLHEGISVFSMMEKQHGVIPRDEHYECIVDLFCQASKLEEAVDIVGNMPIAPSAAIWRSILSACGKNEDLELIEEVSNRMIEMEPHSSLPYLVLAHAYEMRGRWESVVQVRKRMKELGIKKVAGCSWIGIKSCNFAFKSNELLHYGGQKVYSMLRLLMWQMQDERYRYRQCDSIACVLEEE